MSTQQTIYKTSSIAESLKSMIETLGMAYAANLNDHFGAQSSQQCFIFEGKDVGSLVRYDNTTYFVRFDGNQVTVRDVGGKVLDHGITYMRGSNEYYTDKGKAVLDSLTEEEIEDMAHGGGVIFTEKMLEEKLESATIDPYDFEMIADNMKELLPQI